MGNWFLLIEREEMELYRTTLREHGYQEEGFDLSERSDPLPCAWIMAISGEAVIKCIKTGITRYYRAGEGLRWPTEFYNDLNDGVFGIP
jgi:hypothetical protein